jgi:hypothetical protein
MLIAAMKGTEAWKPTRKHPEGRETKPEKPKTCPPRAPGPRAEPAPAPAAVFQFPFSGRFW